MAGTSVTFGRLRRSCLAVPGSNPRMLEKAAGLAADQVFLDLEDAVAPDLKTDATRLQVAAALREQDWHAPTRVVRVNAVGTPWCVDDLMTVVSAAGDALHARRSRSLGFDGKWALHPDQIGICNDTYVPTQEEFDRAERILEAYETATSPDCLGAVAFDGEMIDEASRKMAVLIAARGRAAGMARRSS